MTFDETVVILAGGYGSRLGEYTEKIPKPLVKIGDDPIIIHIMRLWYQAGFRNFVIAGGYKWEKLVYELAGKDWGGYLENSRIRIIDTGLDTGSGGRIKKLESYLTDNFFLSYGDVLTSLPLEVLKSYAEFYTDRLATMLVTNPKGRFGEVEFLDTGLVTGFSEKPISDKWINAGFFGMSKKIINYIENNSDELSEDILPKLVRDEKLMALPTYGEWGYWHCMDTPKDLKELNKMWEEGKAPWKIW